MADEQTARLHAVVEGRVQGVGFRAFVIDHATGYNLTGWVRNTGSGQVEVTAEGQRPQLEQLLADLRQGPRGAFISSVQQDWQPATGEFSRFSVVSTRW